MSQNPHSYAGLPTQEVLPYAADIFGVSHNSFLTRRTKVRIPPQGAQSVSPGGTVSFIIQDSASMLDPRSVRVSWNRVCGGTATTGCTFDDGPAEIHQIITNINGQQLETLLWCNVLANAMMYLGGSEQYYKNAGSWAGWWVLNNDLASGGYYINATQTYGTSTLSVATLAAPLSQTGLTTIKGDFTTAALNATLRFSTGSITSAQAPGTGNQIAISLGLLSPAWRGTQYWPLMLMGQIQVILTLESAGNALYQGATQTTAANYLTADWQLEYDVIQPDERYTNLLRRLAQSPDGAGIVIPVETGVMTLPQQFSTASGFTQNTAVATRTTANLRRLVGVLCPTAGQNNLGYPTLSCFPAECSLTANVAATPALRFQVGSLFFPAQEANTLSRIYFMSKEAFGEDADSDGGVANLALYSITTTSSSPYVVVAPLGTGPVGQLSKGDKFVFAANFDKFQGGEVLDVDGISSAAMASGNVICNFKNSPVEAVQAFICLFGSRYISLKSGVILIEGG